MKNRVAILAARASFLLLLTSASCALAQKQVHMTGLFNDYTPTNVKGGPYEMHGQWSMDVDVDGKAVFLADMTMSDFGTTGGPADASMGGQDAHTHHIRLSDGTLMLNMEGCPAFSPATTLGFQLKGTVNVFTGNGRNAPFETTPPSSTMQVCVSGGNEVPLSNMTIVLGGPATKHFGTQAIHGVVQKVSIE